MVYLINPNWSTALANNFTSFGPSRKQMTYSKEFNEGIIYRDVNRVKGANQGLIPVSRSPGAGRKLYLWRVTAVPLRGAPARVVASGNQPQQKEQGMETQFSLPSCDFLLEPAIAWTQSEARGQGKLGDSVCKGQLPGTLQRKKKKSEEWIWMSNGENELYTMSPHYKLTF